MKKSIVIILMIITIFPGCFYLTSEKPIVNPDAYNDYLTGAHLEKAIQKLSGEIGFWKAKLATNPQNHVFETKLAGLYASQFKLTGEPLHLAISDSLLISVNERVPGQVGVLHALAGNAITQHRFREAERYASQAYEIGEKQFISALLMTDILLERGDFSSASLFLGEVGSTGNFDYLVRDVKYQDQQGDLDKAVQQMEKALDIAIASGNKKIINWSLSNLADMYGHQGRIKKSYETYLKALAFDPADLHSLKGIAWVAFSHDKNTVEAKRIINFLHSVHPVPDYYLLLSEIAAYESDKKTAGKLEQDFISEATRPAYGKMYTSYLCALSNGHPNTLALARSEIENRPHPSVYSLLAWASLGNNDIETAVAIVEDHVLDQTEEPEALYYSGIILKEAGRRSLAKQYLTEAKEAAYELGPVTANEIARHLKEL